MNANELAERLRALGVKLGAQDLKNEAIGVDYPSFPIESVLNGREHNTIFGSTFIHTEKFINPYTHGRNNLFQAVQLGILSEWGKASNLRSADLSQIVFLDTETSGLAGGTGTYAFLIGIGWFSGDHFQVDQLFLRSPDQESALLTALSERLTPFRFIVTFNGKSFDVPLLITRFNMNRISYPMLEFEHIDLLHLARRLWRDRLPSRALGDLEKTVLEFHRTEEEVPGYLIPEYYFDYLRKKDARPLAGVFYHNAIDIVTLASLFKYTAATLENPIACDLPSLDCVAIARLYDDLGYYETAATLYEQGLGQGLPEDFYLRTLQRFAWMCRKHGNWTGALDIWRKAASHNDLTAFCELAKYYEHRLRDPLEALEWVQRGIEAVEQSNAPLYIRQTVENDLTKRRSRLLRKLKEE